MEYKYDVAISCAEEDLQVAEQIAAALKLKGVSYYLYTEHRAAHWGENIFKITLDKYGVESKFVLMLISSIYVNKYWSGIENQIAATITRIGESYILPLRLDDTPVDGLGKNIVFERWKNNAEEIAQLISNRLQKISQPSKPGQQYGNKTEINNAKTIIKAEGNVVNQNNVINGN